MLDRLLFVEKLCRFQFATPGYTRCVVRGVAKGNRHTGIRRIEQKKCRIFRHLPLLLSMDQENFIAIPDLAKYVIFAIS